MQALNIYSLALRAPAPAVAPPRSRPWDTGGHGGEAVSTVIAPVCRGTAEAARAAEENTYR